MVIPTDAVMIEDADISITAGAYTAGQLLTFLRNANDAAEAIVKVLGDAASVPEIEVLDDARVDLVVRLYVA